MTLKNFTTDEQHQVLIGYTLLMAFVALASAAAYLLARGAELKASGFHEYAAHDGQLARGNLAWS
jgi:hypothetical protein